ncbi:uncharacterized protein LOC134818493 [Bolinopsis microptera]|uniref:uncharacterized protein LOC134818493 n=1 Tax=Bolinopsis microptera TaxID=2820187 RepID=UPI00307A60CF
MNVMTATANRLSMREIIAIVFSPVYEDLADKVEQLPKNEWLGLFRHVRGALVTACFMLRSAHAGEPLCISWGDIVGKSSELDVEGRKLYYFQVSPLNGKSCEMVDEKTVKLKTAHITGLPHIFLTSPQWKLLRAYLKKHKSVIKGAVDQQVFCGKYESLQKSKHAARELRWALTNTLKFRPSFMRKRPTPTMIRQSVWSASEEQNHKEMAKRTEEVAHLASTRKKHHRNGGPGDGHQKL